MKALKTPLIPIAFLLLASGVAATQPIAFGDVTVIDVRDGVAPPGMTVVVSGDRISAVGPSGSVDAL